jgi:hypothetical protein
MDAHTDGGMCSICRATWDDNDDPTMFLGCGHRFHIDCMNAYCDVLRCSVHHVACPICKTTSVALDAQAQTMLDAGSTNGVEPICIQDDAWEASAVLLGTLFDGEALDGNADEAQDCEALDGDADEAQDEAGAGVNEAGGEEDAIQPKGKGKGKQKGKGKNKGKNQRKGKNKGKNKGNNKGKNKGTNNDDDEAGDAAGEGVNEAEDGGAEEAIEFNGKGKDKGKGKNNGKGNDNAPKSDLAVINRPIQFGMSDPTVCCCSCGSQCQLVKCRIMSKKAGTWRCNLCNTTHCQLWRIYGKFPKEFERMPENEVQEFFKAMAGASACDLREAAQSIISMYTHEEEYYEEGGEFLPLSVWSAKGFDIMLIESKSLTADKREHTVLGLCYRVKILSTGFRGAQGQKTQNDRTGRTRKRRIKPAIADGVEQEDENKEEESGDSSDSSSSNSSDKKHNKKKRKKNKKDKKVKKEKHKKEREKAKQTQDRHDDKILKARVANKSRMDVKTTAALGALVGKMAQPLALQLPVFLSEQVRAVMTNLQDFIDAGTAASKDIKKTMPEMQDLGW